MIYKKLEEIHLKMEYANISNTEDKYILSGLLGQYWIRFTYFKSSNILVVVNTMTEERLVYQY